MKKTFGVILFFLCISFVKAKEIEVKFSNCVDGDTAKFIYKNEEITARFLAIDTPETVHPTKEEEEYGKEASNYTCKKIKEANKIVLEFDENSDEKDKYNRYLVWVFIDGELLQKKLVRKGLASVSYLYDDYKYTDELELEEQLAEDEEIGIWSISSNEDNTESIVEETEKSDKKVTEENTGTVTPFIEKYKEYIILIGSLIIIYVFNLKPKKKIKTKLKNKIKKDIKKLID